MLDVDGANFPSQVQLRTAVFPCAQYCCATDTSSTFLRTSAVTELVLVDTEGRREEHRRDPLMQGDLKGAGTGKWRRKVGAWPGQCKALVTRSHSGHRCEAVGEAGCSSQPSLGCEGLGFGVHPCI